MPPIRSSRRLALAHATLHQQAFLHSIPADPNAAIGRIAAAAQFLRQQLTDLDAPITVEELDALDTLIAGEMSAHNTPGGLGAVRRTLSADDANGDLSAQGVGIAHVAPLDAISTRALQRLIAAQRAVLQPDADAPR